MKTSELTDSERAERAQIKARHQSVRAAMHHAAKQGGWHHRYALLAWAFVRELPYRRIERDHHRQTRPDGSVYEHNLPDMNDLARALVPHCPEVAADMEPVGRFARLRRGSATEARLSGWLADPAGAIPAPPSRQKKPYAGHKDVSPEPLAAE